MLIFRIVYSNEIIKDIDMSEKQQQSSYKKLLSNTIVFAIGSFSSKVLILLLVPIYSNYMSQGEAGKVDVLQQIANWMIPLATVSISEAIIRFGLDKAYDKKKVFTLGNMTCAVGMIGFALLLFLVQLSGLASKYIGSHALLLYAYVLMSGVKTLYTTFVRSLEKVKLFALAGIVATICTLFFTVLFFMILPADFFGNESAIKKYLLAIILADLLTTVYVTFKSKLWNYFDFKDIDKEMLVSMLQYSIPLIPTALMWLITNSSDSFMTTHYIGEEKNGILTYAYKIPNIVATVYMMFGQAWNMSAITENDSKDRNTFYENVFDFNQSLLYILAGGCMLVLQPVTNIWIGAEFRDCVRYSPLLVYSTIFSCFTTFMGSIYIATRLSKRNMVTALISGIINVGLNVILIPRIGLYGPPITTVTSYLTVFIVRTIDSRKLIPFRIDYKKMITSNVVLVSMMAILLIQPNLRQNMLLYLLLMILFCVVVLINYDSMKSIFFRFLPKSVANRMDRLNKKQLAVLMGGFTVFVVINYLLMFVPLLAILILGALYGAFKEKEFIFMGFSAALVVVVSVFSIAGAGAVLVVMSVIGCIAFMKYRYLAALVIGADMLMCGLYGAKAGILAMLMETVLYTLVFIKRLYAFAMSISFKETSSTLRKIKGSIKLEDEDN